MPVGCGAPPIPYDRAAGAPVATVGFLTPSMSDRPTVFVWGGPGQMFGLVGAIAEAAVLSAREARLVEALASRQFAARPLFIERVSAAIGAQGYRVVPVAVEDLEQLVHILLLMLLAAAVVPTDLGFQVGLDHLIHMMEMVDWEFNV